METDNHHLANTTVLSESIIDRCCHQSWRRAAGTAPGWRALPLHERICISGAQLSATWARKQSSLSSRAEKGSHEGKYQGVRLAGAATGPVRIGVDLWTAG